MKNIFFYEKGYMLYFFAVISCLVFWGAMISLHKFYLYYQKDRFSFANRDISDYDYGSLADILSGYLFCVFRFDKE